jgi:hypothetical protein
VRRPTLCSWLAPAVSHVELSLAAAHSRSRATRRLHLLTRRDVLDEDGGGGRALRDDLDGEHAVVCLGGRCEVAAIRRRDVERVARAVEKLLAAPVRSRRPYSR